MFDRNAHCTSFVDCIALPSSGQLDRGLWRYPQDDRYIFDIKKASLCHFWHEKHILSGILMSEFAMARLNEEDISGFKMTAYATV
jgi:hypothetical protein